MFHDTTRLADVLSEIKSDDRYLKNLKYGQVRRGHPEGTIQAHINELEANLHTVESYLQRAGTPLDVCSKVTLEILIHVHDSFKAEAAPRVRIDDPRSHASLAREFLAAKIDDSNILAMVQHHDVPWSLYQQVQKFGSYNQRRLQDLCSQISTMQVFQLFQIIDNTTLGKVTPHGQSSVKWFIAETSSLDSRSVDLLSLANYLEGSLSQKGTSRLS